MFSRVLKTSTVVQPKSINTCLRLFNSLSLSKPVLAQPSLVLSVLNSKDVNPHIWKENDPMKLPIISNNFFDLPTGLKYVPSLIDPTKNNEIEAPSLPSNSTPLEAARLIVIRRKKMKKHKLKKLRKRMKFEWAKLRQRRELKKEKAFQAVLVQKCKDAEAFSAEKYVEEKLEKLNMEIPQQERKNFWHRPDTQIQVPK